MTGKSLAYLATTLAASPFGNEALASGECSETTRYASNGTDTVQEEVSPHTKLQNVPIRMARPDIFSDRIPIPETNAYIPIVNAPDLLIDGGNVIIDRWGMVVPFRATLAKDVRDKVVHDLRKFVDLAERQELSEEQMVQYEAILDDIDYGLYCELNAPLVYKAARVIGRGKNSVTIQWHHGEDGIEHVKGKLAGTFSYIHVNERFSADVLFVKGKLAYANHVTPLDDIDVMALDDEELDADIS